MSRTLDITDRPLLSEHLGVYQVLLGPNSARDRRDFVEEALGPLVRYDLDHGTDLVDTLRAWVAADYSVTEAAGRLFVHATTLKYRLKRIRALLGGDPSRGDLRLQFELALKLLDVPRLPWPRRRRRPFREQADFMPPPDKGKNATTCEPKYAHRIEHEAQVGRTKSLCQPLRTGRY